MLLFVNEKKLLMPEMFVTLYFLRTSSKRNEPDVNTGSYHPMSFQGK